MRSVFPFIREHERFFALLAALVLSVTMMTMGNSSKTAIVRGVTTAIFNTGLYIFSPGIYVTDLWKENKRLRLLNLNLSNQVNRQDFAIRENERLRRLLGLKKQYINIDSVLVATVIGHDLDSIINILVLNVGSRSGVKKNMAVVTADGLVGKIFEVYRSSCGVQVIKDIQSRISAVSDEIIGLIRWEGGPYLRMYGLPLGNIPKTGAKVYTTGLGNLYPKSILIGTVAKSKFIDVEPYASVNVEPTVDFSSIQEVLILLGSEHSDIWTDGKGIGHFQRPEIE